MLSSTLLALLLLATTPSHTCASTPRRPRPRSYDTHAYYTLELAASSSLSHAQNIAEQLGAEVVEPLGELDGHWIVRTPGQTHEHEHYRRSGLHHSDPVVRRWNRLNRRDDSKRSLTPLTLKKRSKRAPHSLARPHRLYGRDDTEFLFAQNEIGLVDPMLNQQWHLINQEIKDVELNVTGLWSQGVTGSGVRVGIIDDGLDMESDDLAENFVSSNASRWHAACRQRVMKLICSLPRAHTISTTIQTYRNLGCQMINTGHVVLARLPLSPTTFAV